MTTDPIVAHPRKPRCMLLYALAPDGVLPAEANRAINGLISLPNLPLCIWHDHFIGPPGGIAIFDVRELGEVNGIVTALNEYLTGWRTELRPLIFSHNPAALDEQIAYTLSAYGKTDWETLRNEDRPVYVDPLREVEVAQED